MAAEPENMNEPLTPGALDGDCLGRCANCPDAQGLLVDANQYIAREWAAIGALESYDLGPAAEASAERQEWILELLTEAIAARKRTIALIHDGMAALPATCRGPLMTTILTSARVKLGEGFDCRHPAMAAPANPPKRVSKRGA